VLDNLSAASLSSNEEFGAGRGAARQGGPRADRRTPRGRNSLAPHPPPWHHRRLPRQTDGPRTR
jgi:hypothetical protein